MTLILSLILILSIVAPTLAAESPVTVGTGATTVLAAATTRPYRNVAIANQHATAVISCRPSATTPAIGAAGSFDIQPKNTRSWNSANVTWNGPFTCISDTASTPVTVEAD